MQQFRQRTDPITHKMPYASVIHRGATGNLADLEVSHLRGKLLLVFDKEFNSPNFSTDDGYYPYTKYPSIAQTGLTFCGKYSGGVGTSLALKSKNKGNWSAEGSTMIANVACEEHQKHGGGDHLLWVYWQETGGDVLKNTTASQGMHARLDKFLSSIRDQKNNLPRPNRHRARLCQRGHLPQNRENEPGRRYPVLVDDPSLILQIVLVIVLDL